MPYLKEDLGWSYGLVSTAGAVMLTTMALVAPAAGMAIDRHGPRAVYAIGMSLAAIAIGLASAMSEPWQLVLSVGIVGGIGFAAISPSLVSTTVAAYFDRGLGLATGIAVSGSTAGQIALMPLLALLIGLFGWRSSLLIAAAAIVVTAIAVNILIGRRDPAAGPARPGPDRGARPRFPAVLAGLSRQRTFWLLAGGFAICGFTTGGVIKIHLIPYAVACGFPPLESATAYGVMSAFSLAGMIWFGHLSDRFHRPVLLASIYFMRGAHVPRPDTDSRQLDAPLRLRRAVRNVRLRDLPDRRQPRREPYRAAHHGIRHGPHFRGPLAGGGGGLFPRRLSVRGLSRVTTGSGSCRSASRWWPPSCPS